MEFSEYSQKYRNIKMSRNNGILELIFHTDGGSLRWTHVGGAHSEFASAFTDIGRDPENRVVIISGTGLEYSGPSANEDEPMPGTAENWDIIQRNGVAIIMGLLNIDAPIISCINGPALRHPEVPLLADIVLASDTAIIQDSAHFTNRVVPGDGMNVIMPLLMGYTRGRYFLLTGQKIDAHEALLLGLVNEVHSQSDLLPRAQELANELVKQNPLVLRYTRRLLMHPLKKAMHEILGYGLALEGLAYIDEQTNQK